MTLHQLIRPKLIYNFIYSNDMVVNDSTTAHGSTVSDNTIMLICLIIVLLFQDSPRCMHACCICDCHLSCFTLGAADKMSMIALIKSSSYQCTVFEHFSW